MGDNEKDFLKGQHFGFPTYNPIFQMKKKLDKKRAQGIEKRISINEHPRHPSRTFPREIHLQADITVQYSSGNFALRKNVS